VAAKVDDEIWIVAEGLLDNVMTAVGKTYSTIVSKPSSRELERRHCSHPLVERKSLVILGEHVTLEAGTGAVHTAPGHGQEDYDVGMRYGLEPLAPIDNAGKFTDEAQLPWLTGLYVEDANGPIIEHLRDNGSLVSSENISHSYPHCWRCKKPIVFRSTEQWFISMEKEDLRKLAIGEIEKVQWIPPWGKNRIGGMVEARPDWCISRQRVWGVPIVAVGCKSCGEIHTTKDLVEKAASKFEEAGADVWFSEPVESFIPKGFECPACGQDKPGEFVKERDILDVWFDSGISYAAVLENEEKIVDPADLYLEGSDQHRGWFHTALLTSVATRGRAPYRRVLTHGFVVDGEGKKYSKSAGNYVPPEEIIKKHGAEILRMWVAAEDYRDDIRFSDEILTRLIDAYRKIRNTLRFLLGNIGDFDPSTDQVSDDQLSEIDRWAMAELEFLVERVLRAYDRFEFHQIYHSLNRFCTVELSSFYLDILKDRLYAEKKDGTLRRAAQTVLWRIAREMVCLMAPIFSFTSDEIWEYLPQESGKPDSVFLSKMPSPEKKWSSDELRERWQKLIQIRAAVTKVLENARAAKAVGNSLAAKVVIETTDELKTFLETFGEGLPDLFIVSQVEFGKTGGDYVVESEEVPEFKVSAHAADGTKCSRCWKFSTSVGSHADHPEICDRCLKVITS
jgi:isoleucyl-tRNA synthetase